MVEKIVDYIKSCFYYPTMKRWFDERNISKQNPWNNRKFARFRYAWWHCHIGKLKNK